MSKKSALILGYTRTGLAVRLPPRRTPVMADFVNWSRSDHVDASHILMEHGERESNAQVGRWCMRWACAHQETSRAPRRAYIRGGAEIAVLARRRR